MSERPTARNPRGPARSPRLVAAGGEHLLLLRMAWSNAGLIARKQFLSEVVDELCRRPHDPASRRAAGRDPLVDDFLATQVIRSPHDQVQATKLLARFNAFGATCGAPPWTSRRLADQLKLRGLRSERHHFAWWVGLRLTDQATSPPAPPAGAQKLPPKPSK